jgi:hypothetical protein
MLENICFSVGGGLSFASAYRIKIGPGKERIILNNGIHRAFKLAQMHFEWVPLIVADLSPEELPPQFVDLPQSLLTGENSNPPLISDFLNSDVCIGLKYYPVLKTLRFNWNFEQYVTVLK